MKRKTVNEEDLVILLQDINRKIQSKEFFCLTDVLNKHSIPPLYRNVLNEREIIKLEARNHTTKKTRGREKVVGRYVWTNGLGFQFNDTLKTYATRIKQDYTEYRRLMNKRQRPLVSLKSVPSPVKSQTLPVVSPPKLAAGLTERTINLTKASETPVSDGFTPITKETLLRLREISSFHPFTLAINDVKFLQINSCKIIQNLSSDYITLRISKYEGETDRMIGEIILENKKIYYFKRELAYLEIK